MFQFNIAIYITIFLSIIGCNYNRLNQDHCDDPNPDHTKPVIVLLHGLNEKASCFDSLADNLKKSFPTAEVVALCSVEAHQTGLFSITEQANGSFDELSKKVSSLQNSPMLLIGHSQGGLRAYSMYDKYKDALNVKGIITLATPWEGAPILSTDEALLSECFRAPVLEDMCRLSKDLGHPTNWLEEQLIATLNTFAYTSGLAGCNDLQQESNFLGWVKNTLPGEKVPILAIGGGQNDFSIFLPSTSNYHFKALNKVWTKVIVGKWTKRIANKTHFTKRDKRHDMIVPLDSQLAWNIIPEGNQNFKRIVIPDALHSEFLKLPPSKKSNTILAHPDMFKAVKSFAKSVLYNH